MKNPFKELQNIRQSPDTPLSKYNKILKKQSCKTFGWGLKPPPLFLNVASLRGTWKYCLFRKWSGPNFIPAHQPIPQMHSFPQEHIRSDPFYFTNINCSGNSSIALLGGDAPPHQDRIASTPPKCPSLTHFPLTAEFSDTQYFRSVKSKCIFDRNKLAPTFPSVFILVRNGSDTGILEYDIILRGDIEVDNLFWHSDTCVFKTYARHFYFQKGHRNMSLLLDNYNYYYIFFLCIYILFNRPGIAGAVLKHLCCSLIN